MWWGVWVDGELMAVQWFRRDPSYFDFTLGFFSSASEYDVAPVRVERCALPLQ